MEESVAVSGTPGSGKSTNYLSTAAIQMICAVLSLSAAATSRPAVVGSATADHAEIDSRLDALFGSHQNYEKFLDGLKASVAAQDWHAVAATVAYPIEIRIAGHRILLRTPDELARHAAAIFDAKVVAAVQGQSYGRLFATSNGVMIGEGEVWFSGICKDSQCIDPVIKITAINP